MTAIRVNGETRTVDEDASVAALVEALLGEPEPRGVAVAVNRRVVPRSRWHSTPVREGDEVELVKATQGG